MKKIAGIFTIACIASLTTIGLQKAFENKKEVSITKTSSKSEQSESVFRFASLSDGPETAIDFTTAAEQTVNTVVHVKTMYEGEKYLYHDPFYDFLWGFGKKQYEYQAPPRHGTGSGVIISSDGYIVTNNHVIKDANVVEITLNDQRTYTAEVIGTDPSTDLSLIKIEERDLPFIVYGNSDHVRIGEWVLAVGNPYNLTSTVTAGIVSAKGRNIDILRDKFKIESFIQTDAAVNPGNSGGALVNTSGELIGINSAIASPTGSYSGYSFAIPVNIVKKVMNDLMEYGEVQRAFIGVTIQNMDAKLAEELGIDKISGIYINGMTDDGAAKQAGMKQGDVITQVDFVDVDNVPELQEQIGNFRPGDQVKVTILRNGEEKVIPLTLKNRYGNTKIVQKTIRTTQLLGATFEEITDDQKRKLKTDNGVQITKLENGKLKNAGIKEGFIITKIDKKIIRSQDDIASALEHKKGGVLIEGIYPNGVKVYYGFGV